MAVVYIHRREDDNTIFYVGIGAKCTRAFIKCNRSKWWHKIANKHGYTVEIILDDLSWKEACDKERELIKEYGKLYDESGILCNFTDGGDGTNGFKFSKESKIKMSLASKGKPKKLYRQNYHHSEETKLRLSNSKKGKSAKNKKKVILNNTEIFESITEASINKNITISTIGNNLTGRSKLTKLGKWEYYNE